MKTVIFFNLYKNSADLTFAQGCFGGVELSLEGRTGKVRIVTLDVMDRAIKIAKLVQGECEQLQTFKALNTYLWRAMK